MKILFVLDYYVPHVGWAETLFRNVIERLAKKGHQIKVLTCRHNADVPVHEVMGANIEVYRVGSGRFDLMWHALGKTGRTLAQEADAIHTTTYSAAVPAFVLGRLVRKKVVLTALEVFGKLWYRFMGWKGFFYLAFERILFWLPFDRYLCISNYTKNNLRISFGIEDAKMSTAYCWIDSDFWSPERTDASKIASIRKEFALETAYSAIFFGRPGVSKGLEHFIAAIPAIIAAIPDFRAVCIVSSDEAERAEFVRGKVRELGVEDRVAWIPGVRYEELRNYVSACNVAVIPSLVEGFWFSAAEACALGKPIVVSNVASLPEVVSGRVAYAEPGNPADIARAVIGMKAGKFETIPAKRFSWDENVEKAEAAYRDILETNA